MNNELRPAVLVINSRNRTRCLFFADHNAAYEVLKAFGERGERVVMVSPEIYGPGEYPKDMPDIQQSLLDQERDQ